MSPTYKKAIQLIGNDKIRIFRFRAMSSASWSASFIISVLVMFYLIGEQNIPSFVAWMLLSFSAVLGCLTWKSFQKKNRVLNQVITALPLKNLIDKNRTQNLLDEVSRALEKPRLMLQGKLLFLQLFSSDLLFLSHT